MAVPVSVGVRGSQNCSRSDVIMIVLSWCGSLMVWFAVIYPCRCHHECSLMFVRELLQVTIINASDYHKCKSFAHGGVPGGGHVDVIMNVLSWWFAVIYPCRCHHECSLMVWFSHGVVPGGGHVDVINYSQL